MKILFILIVLCCSFSLKALEEIVDFGENPGNLRMFLYSPKSTENAQNLRVVIVLHGCSQSAKKIELQSGWSKLAEKYGFIVIYPQERISNNPMSCFRWYSYDKKELDEVNSVMSMLSFVQNNYSVDSSRFFIYGVSAGAVLGVHTMVRNPESFSAGASLAGGPFKIGKRGIDLLTKLTFPVDRTPSEWLKRIPISSKVKVFPKLIVLHGTADPVNHFKNSIELTEQWSTVVHTSQSADSVELQFCQNESIKRSLYFDKNQQSKIVLYEILDGGHTIPIDPGHLPHQGGTSGAFTADRDWFSTYYIAKDFGLIP